MASEWTRVRRTDVKAFVEDSGRVRVHVELAGGPPPHPWQTLFRRDAQYFPLTATADFGGLMGKYVWVTCESDELEAVVAEVDKRIQSTNDEFERDVVPKQLAAKAQAEAEQAEKARFAAELQERVRTLPPPS